MRLLLFFFLLPTLGTTQIVDLYTIPSQKVDLNPYIEHRNEIELKEVPSFQASDFITVEQYALYLKTVRYDSTESFFQSQLPDFGKLGNLDSANYFINPLLLKEPVVGISWRQAVNFCIWLNTIHGNDNVESYYRLPFLSEWIAIDQYKLKKGEKLYLTINETLSDWLLNSYDESVYQFHSEEVDLTEYTYFSHESDPPSLKRKRAVGSNFKYDIQDKELYRKLYFYEDSTYAHLGFRIIKTSPNETISRTPSLSWSFTRPVSNDQSKHITHSDTFNGSWFIYDTQNDLFHGEFTEFDNEGRTIQGKFDKNQRTGIWTVKDRRDNLILARLYCDNTRYIPLFPDHSTSVSSSLIESAKFEKKYHADGYRIYDYVREADVLYAKRLWSRVNFQNNPLIAESGLFEALKKAVLSGDIIAYSAGDDQFQSPLSISKAKDLFEHDFTIEGFEIKEDFFLDRNRVVGEIRIIGFAPYFKDETTDDLKNVCWFYFPQCRKLLSSIKIKNNHRVQNLDELFYWRHFTYKYFKESNLYDRDEISISSQNQKLRLISLEHTLWIEFNR